MITTTTPATALDMLLATTALRRVVKGGRCPAPVARLLVSLHDAQAFSAATMDVVWPLNDVLQTVDFMLRRGKLELESKPGRAAEARQLLAGTVSSLVGLTRSRITVLAAAMPALDMDEADDSLDAQEAWEAEYARRCEG